MMYLQRAAGEFKIWLLTPNLCYKSMDIKFFILSFFKKMYR